MIMLHQQVGHGTKKGQNVSVDTKTERFFFFFNLQSSPAEGVHSY